MNQLSRSNEPGERQRLGELGLRIENIDMRKTVGMSDSQVCRIEYGRMVSSVGVRTRGFLC